MRTGFLWLDKAVDRIGYWWGAYILLGGALTWVGKQLVWLQPYGWPEATFLGIGATLVVMLVVSAFLVALRFFRPPQGRLVKIENGGKPVLAEEVLGDIKSRLDGIERNINRNNKLLVDMQGDVRPLVDIMAEILAHSLLFNSVPLPPHLTTQYDNVDEAAIALKIKVANEYCETVFRVLKHTQWGGLVRSAMNAAPAMADAVLKSSPQEKRPRIDPYQWRDYCIAIIKRDRLAEIVDHAKDEAPTVYNALLSRIHERQEFNRQLNRPA